VKNHHFLFLISEILNQLSDVKIFIKLDLKNVYHCICIKMNNKWKMMFCMCYNHFKYLIMSFKFINTSAIFQIYINRALTKLMNFICVVYLNNILIYLQSEKEHKHHVCKILKWLQHYKLYANLKKCVFSINIVKFFKFIVSIIDVMMNLWRVDIIMKWLTFKMFQKVQVFLNFINFYRCFIKVYSQIVSSLTSLLKSNKNEKKTELFKWFENTEKTFCKLKDVFITALIFVYFDFNLKNWVKTDTLNYVVMRIYTQLQVFRQWNLIAYWLCKLLSAKNSYKTCDLKFLIIVETFKQWHHYLEKSSHSIEILTDHNNLCEFMNVKMLNERQAQ